MSENSLKLLQITPCTKGHTCREIYEDLELTVRSHITSNTRLAWPKSVFGQQLIKQLTFLAMLSLLTESFIVISVLYYLQLSPRRCGDK